ncbi:MAG: DUF2132 domain-containing protein [Spirochaetales bacterium]|nr:DUF2132 domain-containing protein [Spirochaetales bacterium]
MYLIDIGSDGENQRKIGNRPEEQVNNPLHGVTLEQIVTRLVGAYGWHELGRKIKIKCFTHDPSVRSSLKFLRKSPWARAKVESLYIDARRIGRI